MGAVFFLLSLLALRAHAQRYIDENIFLSIVQYGANKFAVNLFKEATTNEPGNFITSPFSVYMTLAMASYGARDETRWELKQVLHLPEGTEAESISILESIRAINHKLQQRSLQPVTLVIGNKIFVASDVSLNPTYRDIIRGAFKSYPQRVNFENPPEAAARINSWSSWSTAGKIKEIVTPDQFDGSTRLMLINTVYFLGEWKVPFNPEYTESLPFYVSHNVFKNVPTMNREGKFQYGVLHRMDASFIVLPYQDNGNPRDATYMYIILPNRREGLTILENNIDSLTMDDLHRTKKNELVLRLPKFKIESTFELKDHLYQLGIMSAFTDSANFDGMTYGNDNLQIDQVLQKAVISIDERGTEAAATTAIEFSSRMMPQTFNVNRPFLVVVATQDVILFTGKVVDPCLECSIYDRNYEFYRMTEYM